VVFARGGLRFYGDDNARRRGLGPRPDRSRDATDPADPFGLDITADDKLRELYHAGEHLDGYIRDRDVFSGGITIEDNLSAVVGYRRGASMAYTLHAHSPWEGYRVAVNGTAGRIELDVVERGHVVPAVAHPDGGAPRQRGARLLLQRHWEVAEEVPIPSGTGSHGGGDPMLLDDVFRGSDSDPLSRQAGYVDGAASVLVGVAGNESLRTGQAVYVADLGLPPLTTGEK
jgi:hypothetical protein